MGFRKSSFSFSMIGCAQRPTIGAFEKKPDLDPTLEKNGSGFTLRKKTGSGSDPLKQPGAGFTLYDIKVNIFDILILVF